jgi:tetratricopeptide (TPR) repeat protein
LGNASQDSADASFGRLAADWMASGLSQTGLVDVVDAQTAALTAPGGTVPGTPAGLRRLAADAQATTLVVGRYFTTPESLVVQVLVEDAASGHVLRTLPRIAVRRRDYGRAVALLREHVSGAFATLVDPRVNALVDRAALAPSLDAYRAYAAGLDCYVRTQGGSDLDDCPPARGFAAAIAADSSWTLPYVWLMYVSLSAGRVAIVDSLLRLLDARRGYQSELDRQTIEIVRRSRRDDEEGALAAARRAVALAPRSNWTYNAALSAYKLGRFRESLGYLRQHDLEHGWVRGWMPYLVLLQVNEHALGEYRAELRDMSIAERLDHGNPLYVAYRLGALAGLGDTAAILLAVDSVIASPPELHGRGPTALRHGTFLVSLIVDVAAHGHRNTARRIADRCLASVDPPTASTMEERSDLQMRAECFYQLERWNEAKVTLDRAVPPTGALGPRETWLIERRLTRIALRMGDSVAAAEHLSRALAVSLPGNRAGDSLAIVARLAAIRGRKAQAVELLRQMPVQRAGWTMMVHVDPDLQTLSDYPALRALIAPRG